MTFLHDWILAFCLLVCFLSYTNIHEYKHKITALSKRKTVVDPREGRELGVEVGPPSNKNCGYLDFSFEKKKDSSNNRIAYFSFSNHFQCITAVG